MKFICRKVDRIRFYHKIIKWVAHTFFKTNIFFCTLEVLKKEMNKRKRMIKNIKRLVVDTSSMRKKFKKGYDEIDIWQKEADIMEKELKRWL